MNLLVLLTDAYGGCGGIAKFNRDMIETLLTFHECRVTALPRHAPGAPIPGNPRLDYRTHAAGSRARYVTRVIQSLGGQRFDAVICAHIHLLPVAWLAARVRRIPLLLVIHGVEAWKPTGRPLVERLAHRIDAFVAVSEVTKTRFLTWTGLSDCQAILIPNCIDRRPFGLGPRPRSLMERYGLVGRHPVLLTLGRLVATRHKGIDEVMDVVPDLMVDFPDLAYVVAGEGDDTIRLRRKAAAMNLEDRVVFTGYVAESEKADHYRLADVFVMAGHGEGFGIVYLEALACGIPVVASLADASREAVLEGRIGAVVDPDDPEDLKRGIREALARESGSIPGELELFSVERFRQRWQRAMHRVVKVGEPATGPDDIKRQGSTETVSTA